MRVVIIGAGGHGTVVADILLRMRGVGGCVEPVAFVDERPATECRRILSLPVLAGGFGALTAVGYDAVVVAVGDNAARRRLCERLVDGGVALFSALHPSSVIAPDAVIEPGVVICAGAVVNSASRIGLGAIVNTQASVDHHNWIGDYAHVAPGVHLGGNVSVGDGTLLGIGCTVSPGRRIGANTVVGAGTVIVRDLPDAVVAVGVPARVRRSAPARVSLAR